MSHSKNTVSPKAALALLTTTNGVCFMLLLLSFARNAETSTRAKRELLASLAPRITAQVRAWLAEQGVIGLNTPLLVQAALEYVGNMLAMCHSRSPKDFAAHVEKLVLRYLEGDGDAPSSRRAPEVEDAALLSPAPKAERTAVLFAILARLTPAERFVLEQKLLPRATWETVARALGTSISTAQRRHAVATERAQLVAVDVLSECLEECAQSEIDATYLETISADIAA